MNAPGLSVIILNHNHAQNLSQCLDTMLGQSVQAGEILVIDDASTDDNAPIIESYARRFPQLRLIRNPCNQGVVSTIDHGLQVAVHEYVYFGAADDFILPGFFEKSLTLLNQHPQAALCCSIGKWRDVVSETVRVAGDTMSETTCYFSPASMVELETQSRPLIASQTAMIEREALLKTGEFIAELKWLCDRYTNDNAGFRGGICVVLEMLMVFPNLSRTDSRTGTSQRAIYRSVLRRMSEQLEA